MTDGREATAGPTVRLDLPLAHAEALESLLDLATRIHMGQVSEVATLVSTGALPIRDDAAPDGRRRGTVAEVEDVEAALRGVASALGHPSGSHYGIASTSPESLHGYEVMKVLQKTLHDHLRPEVRHVVAADGLWRRFVGGPAPVAAIVG